MLGVEGDISAQDSSTHPRGYQRQVKEEPQYGTSGRSPSGGRGRQRVGQRGDPGSGAGH